LALTLKTLCGLSIAEIAHSFLTSEETVSKRIYRAKEKIRTENINLDSPAPANIPDRLDAVLHSLYLLFNEGYNSSHTDNLIRHDLCEEALRLCLLLVNSKTTNIPNASALLSLMCFQASRAEARINDDGSIILLKDQNRSTWNAELIERGKYYLEQATNEDQLSEYHLEAAIAACHSDAHSFDQTNWQNILALYEALSKVKPSPIVEMNKAIASGYGKSAEAGLAALNEVEGIDHLYLYHAALGDFYTMINKIDNARSCYEKAMSLTSSLPEKKLLQKKITTTKTQTLNN
jgi:RNA polymerase sigma-70 factor (ECF subfamily)